MPRMLLRRFATCLVGIAIVASRSARADAPEEAIGLAYSAPDGCASAGEFFDRLHARAPVRRVETGAARTFEITIAATPSGAHGSLTIRTAEGVTAREVDGQTCDETISALVVVAALAIATAADARPAEPPAVSVAPLRSGPPAQERWIAVGSGVTRYQGVVPDSAFGGSAFVAVGRNRGPRLRAGFTRTEENQVAMAVGTTAFRWTAGRIDLSPLTLAYGRLDVAPAIGLEAGALDGRGTAVAMPAGGLRPWVAPDLALRIRVLVDRFALELEGILAVPLVRDRFYIAPGTVVHEVPHATTGVGLSLAMGVW